MGFSKPRIINILAMGPSRSLCPFTEETWSLNMGYKQILEMGGGRIDKIFLAHTQVYAEFDKKRPRFDWNEMNILADAGCEIINTHKVKGLKSKLYPMQSVINKLGRDYFSDTVAYMVAYAIYLYTVKDKETGMLKLSEPLELFFYGADFQDLDEYGTEKPSVEYWIGYAEALGVRVHIPIDSTLLITPSGKKYGEDIERDSYDPLGLRFCKTVQTPEQIQRKMEKYYKTTQDTVIPMTTEENDSLWKGAPCPSSGWDFKNDRPIKVKRASSSN